METCSFDKDIYLLPAIEQAIRDYQRIVRISCADRDGKFVCTFMESRYPMEQTMDEFSNYVLALTAQMQRGSHVD